MTPHQIHDNGTLVKSRRVTASHSCLTELRKTCFVSLNKVDWHQPSQDLDVAAAVWYQDVITTRCGEGAPVAKRLQSSHDSVDWLYANKHECPGDPCKPIPMQEVESKEEENQQQ